MSFRVFPYEPVEVFPTQLGLIVLQSDETVEQDFRRLFGPEVELQFTRIRSGADVTPETLAAMEGDLGASAELLCPWTRFAAVGYGCTSGTAQIGRAQVAALVSAGHRRGPSPNPSRRFSPPARRLGSGASPFCRPTLRKCRIGSARCSQKGCRDTSVRKFQRVDRSQGRPDRAGVDHSRRRTAGRTRRRRRAVHVLHEPSHARDHRRPRNPAFHARLVVEPRPCVAHGAAVGCGAGPGTPGRLARL